MGEVHEKLSLEIVEEGESKFVANLVIWMKLIGRIKAAQENDPRCTKLKRGRH